MVSNNWKTHSQQRLSIHDPSVIQDSDNFYIFGTHLTAAKTQDFIHWQSASNTGYESMENNMLLGNVIENLAESLRWAGFDDADTKGGYGIWAPDILWNPYFLNNNSTSGAYMYFYSVSSTWRRSAIGFATAQEIENVFIYGETLVYSGFSKIDATDGSERNINYLNTHLKELIETDIISGFNDDWVKDNGQTYNTDYAPNAIDPSVFFDQENKLWMVYGSWSGGIYILELDPQTALPFYPGKDQNTEDGSIVDRYFGKKLVGGYHQSGEGPYIFFNQQTNYYYLYLTYGELRRDGAYNMRVFRSHRADGPYRDMNGQLPIYKQDDVNERFGLKVMGNYRLNDQSTAYKSSGHNSLININDHSLVLFHTRFASQDERFELRVHQTLITESGWPAILPFEYTGEVAQTQLSDEAIVGLYDWLNHGTLSDDDVKRPLQLNFGADGQISGEKNGSWKRLTGNALQVQLGNLTFSCQLFLQKNPHTQEVGQVLTGVGHNMTVWGIKTNND